jgi:heptosyltransferase-2
MNNHACMRDIPADDVAEIIQSVMAEASNRSAQI